MRGSEYMYVDVVEKIEDLASLFGQLATHPDVQIVNLIADRLEIRVPQDLWNRFRAGTVTVEPFQNEYRVYKQLSNGVLVYTSAAEYRARPHAASFLGEAA